MRSKKPRPRTGPVPLLAHRFRAGSGLVDLDREAFEQLKNGQSVKLPNDVWHPPPLYARELIALDPDAAALDFEPDPARAMHALIDHAAYCARTRGRMRMIRPLAEVLDLPEPPDAWIGEGPQPALRAAGAPSRPSPGGPHPPHYAPHLTEDRLDAQAWQRAAHSGAYEGRWAVCESGDPASSAEYVLIRDHVCRLRCRRVWNRLSEIQLFPFAIKK